MTEALIYCHHLGVNHRDIRPQNMLLYGEMPDLNNHDNLVVKLTDFGSGIVTDV